MINFGSATALTLCGMFIHLTLKSLTREKGKGKKKRVFLHAADAVRTGHKRVTIRTVDTDVVVLAVATFSEIAPTEMWIAFGVGSRYM